MPPSLAQIGVFTTSYMNLESAAALGTPPSSQRPSGWECSSGLTHKPGRALLFGTRRHKKTTHGPRCRPRYTRPLTDRRSRGAASTGSIRRAHRCVWSAWHDHGPGSVCKLGARSDKTRVSSPVRHQSLDVQMRTPLPTIGGSIAKAEGKP